jgi:hypothetical protein
MMGDQVRELRVGGAEPAYRELEVVDLPAARRPGSWRGRVAMAWQALGGHPGEGFILASAHELVSLQAAIGGPLVVPETDAICSGPSPRYRALGSCSHGCAVLVRPFAPSGEEAGWIDVGFLSPPKARHDASLRGRIGNAVAALLGHTGWAAWDPITQPQELLAALAEAGPIAFPTTSVGTEAHA